MDGCGRHESDAGVPMDVVVPVEERPCEAPGVQDRIEAVREAGAVLPRLELRLRVGAVGGGVGSRVGFGNAQVGEQEGDRLGAHRATAVGMDRELARVDALLLDSLCD